MSKNMFATVKGSFKTKKIVYTIGLVLFLGGSTIYYFSGSKEVSTTVKSNDISKTKATNLVYSDANDVSNNFKIGQANENTKSFTNGAGKTAPVGSTYQETNVKDSPCIICPNAKEELYEMDKNGTLHKIKGEPKVGSIITKNGKQYLVNPDGSLTLVEDGKIVNIDGKAYKMVNGKLVPILEAGSKVGDIVEIDGKFYKIDKNGNLIEVDSDDVKGIVTKDNQKFFIDNKGNKYKISKDGIVTKDGKKFYIDKNGNLVEISKNGIFTDKNEHKMFVDKNGNVHQINPDGTVTIDGEKYYIDENGNLLKIAEDGTVLKNGVKTYIDKNGNEYIVGEDGLITVDGEKYRIDKDGNLVKIDSDGEIFTDNGDKFFTDELGGIFSMLGDGLIIDKKGNKFFVDENGKKHSIDKKGYFTDKKGNKFFVDKDGNLYSVNSDGSVTIDGVDYRIDKDGNSHILSKDKTYIDENDNLVFVDKAGKVHNVNPDGSVTIDGVDYHIDKNGNLIKINPDGSVTIDGVDYYIDKNGNLIKINPDGSVVIDGKKKFLLNYKKSNSNTSALMNEALDNMKGGKALFDGENKADDSVAPSGITNVGGSIVINSDITMKGKDKDGNVIIATIKSGTVLYATTDLAIDTDYKTPVIATVVVGQFKGAKLFGNWSSASEWVDGLTLEFNRILWHDLETSITAIGIDASDGTGLYDDVNKHWGTRIGGVLGGSLFGALEGASEPFANSNQQNTIVTPDSGGSAEFSEYLPPTGEQIAFMALGGASQKLSESLGESMFNEWNRPATITIDRGHSLGIVFMNKVEFKKDEDVEPEAEILPVADVKKEDKPESVDKSNNENLFKRD